jgi:hypothetical protein
VIVQLFNWPFERIASEIPRLRMFGYTHIHISPPQPSADAVWQWWGRYQPLSYSRLTGPLGSEAEFRRMTRAAARNDLTIIVDVVAINPCQPPGLLFGVPSGRRDAAFAAGLRYLRWLCALGATWFRFDGVARVPPEFLAWALPQLPHAKAFGEIVSDDFRLLRPYLAVAGFALYDFPLLARMRAAFGPGGDLRQLRAPERNGGALLPAQSIAFVRNHDIERGQLHDRGIDEPAFRVQYGVGWDEATETLDQREVHLAHAYLFGRAGGIPYVLSGMPTVPPKQQIDRYDAPDVGVLLYFRASCIGADARPEIWRLATRRAIGWQRGHDRFCVINASTHSLHLDRLRTTLRAGLYCDVRTGRMLEVGQSGCLSPCSLPARQAALFVRLPAAEISGRNPFTRRPGG